VTEIANALAMYRPAPAPQPMISASSVLIASIVSYRSTGREGYAAHEGLIRADAKTKRRR
jgi:hypothetical protein